MILLLKYRTYSFMLLLNQKFSHLFCGYTGLRLEPELELEPEPEPEPKL